MKTRLFHQTHHAEKGDTTRIQKKFESLPQFRIHHMCWLVHLSFFYNPVTGWFFLILKFKLLFIRAMIYPYLLHSRRLQVVQIIVFFFHRFLRTVESPRKILEPNH